MSVLGWIFSGFSSIWSKMQDSDDTFGILRVVELVNLLQVLGHSCPQALPLGEKENHAHKLIKFKSVPSLIRYCQGCPEVSKDSVSLHFLK